MTANLPSLTCKHHTGRKAHSSLTSQLDETEYACSRLQCTRVDRAGSILKGMQLQLERSALATAGNLVGKPSQRAPPWKWPQHAFNLKCSPSQRSALRSCMVNLNAFLVAARLHTCKAMSWNVIFWLLQATCQHPTESTSLAQAVHPNAQYSSMHHAYTRHAFWPPGCTHTHMQSNVMNMYVHQRSQHGVQACLPPFQRVNLDSKVWHTTASRI